MSSLIFPCRSAAVFLPLLCKGWCSAAAVCAYDGRHTCCSTAVSNAVDGCRTTNITV
ncbi:MAG: hypothetical protein HXL33_08785 [Prevotellaceae bacterium]|nr:hypothetical protein [Prevotellaceae bacterium]MBF1073803.1 hypothetical protein [Prevotellaceae bacterium]